MPPNHPSDFGFLSGGNAKDASAPGWSLTVKAAFGTAVRDSPATTFDWSAATNQARSRASDQANFSQPFSAALAGESSGVAMAQTNPTRRMVNPLTIFMSLTFHFWPDAKP